MAEAGAVRQGGFLAAAFHPPLTTVSQPRANNGRQAMTLLLEVLDGKPAAKLVEMPTQLKIRGSTARAVTGEEGEDLVEKQNAEQGLMPVLEDEAGVYGYTDENRHMVECFRKGEVPLETFEDGLAVVEILMALYRSAEIGETVHFPAPHLEDYVPVVARRDA